MICKKRRSKSITAPEVPKYSPFSWVTFGAVGANPFSPKGEASC